MYQKTKSLVMKLLAVAMTFCCMLGVWFALPFGKGKEVKAEETLDVTDMITFTQDDWMSGSPTDCITLSIRINKADGGYLYEYLVANSSIQGCWNDNGTSYATTNGVDIMEYLYFNGESARSIVTKNQSGTTTFAGTTSPLSNGSVFSPIAVETTGSWTSIKILNAWIPEDGFTITVKKGFQLVLNDGTMITTSSDVMFKYANSAITKVAKAVDVTDMITFTQDDWMSGNPTDCITLSIRINNAGGGYLYEYVVANSSIQGCWNDNGTKYATTNGLDIMEYLYFNGESVRSIVSKNQSGTTTFAGATSPLSNGGVFSPIAVETGSLWTSIKILNAWIPENGFTIAVKKGFQLVLNDGNMITTSSDVTFKYANGAITKVQQYTLSFSSTEGAVDPMTVIGGEAIGALPAVPEKSDHTGVWTIDGVEINADTVYSYGANKTATAVYTKNVERIDVTDLLTLEDWGAINNETDNSCFIVKAATGDVADNYIHAAADLCCYWNDNAGKASLNNGCDLMEYIFIDGVSARSIVSSNNSNYGATTFPANMGGVYAPIIVETTGNGAGMFIKVLTAYKDTFSITIKAGFTLMTTANKILHVSQDITYKHTPNNFTKVQQYILSFSSTEGAVDPMTVIGGEAIGTLPAVPEKSGYTGVWTIDGVEITADTVYSYGANKTAVATYTKNVERIDVTETVTIDPGAGENQSQFKIELIPATALTSNAWWNINGSSLTAANNGVDIMNYIYINNQNIRVLSDDNRTNNTYPVDTASGWLTNSDQCRPVFVETSTDGVYVTVLHAFSTSKYTITLKAGFELLNADGDIYTISEDVEFLYDSGTIERIYQYTLSFEGLDDTIVTKTGQTIGTLPELPEVEGEVVLGWAIDGVAIDETTVWQYTENKTATLLYAQQYTLSFESLDDTLTVIENQAIGELPKVPAKDGCEGVWTLDGVEITADTVYTYGADKTAVAVYTKNINKLLGLDDQNEAYGNGDYCFVAQINGAWFNANESVSGVWNINKDTLTSANAGVDIMEYIYVKDNVSARAHSNTNASTNEHKGEGGWLANGYECAPIFVESTTEGLWIRIDKDFAGNYFEIVFKAGFRLVDTEGTVVYLAEDVTYKYINDGTTVTFAKGEITDADLDNLEGQQVTLMNGETTHFDANKRQLILPELAPVMVDEGLSQVFIGWTTDTDTLLDLYPAGYKLIPDSATTLYAVWLGFEMQDGAAVRLTSGSSGIRFLVDIDKGGYDFGVNLGLISDVGTILVPTDYLKHVEAFEHRYFAEGQYSVASKYALGENWIWTEPETEGAPWTYAAAFVNISETQYSRRFSARGYLKIQYTTGEGYVYTPYNEEQNARSIYEVSTSAYEDETRPEYKTNETILNYINKVADLTWSADNYTFTRTEKAYGNYEITGIEIDSETAKVTVQISGDVASVVVNGERLASQNNVNVALGNYVYNLSNFVFSGNEFSFTIGAANNDYDKVSDETLYFYSSNEDLDFFLNDFFKRHSGYTEDGVNLKVNSVTGGVNSEEFFSHEWLSMAYYWYNSDDGYAEDRIAGLREFLSSVPVDDYGYVWQSNDKVLPDYAAYDASYHRMGWPIPHAGTLKTAHWDFNGSGDSGNWSSNVGASISNGLYKASLTNQSSNITFTSNTFTSAGLLASTQNYTYRAPLLQMDIRIADASNVEDIYVYYTTSSSKTFSEDKKVSVKDKAMISYDYSGEYNHFIVLPMYAETAWGSSESTYVRQIKIEIALKSGKTISGDVALNSVRLVADTRHSNNNSILISSLRQDYDFTGDLDYLTANITRARKAMNFLMQMYDSSRNLLKGSYLVGHDGDKSGTWSPEKVAGSMSNGYWDIMFMPEYDFQSNTYFYKALADMAYLEGVLAKNNITVDTSLATIKTATRDCTHGTSAYGYTADSLKTTANAVKTAIQATTDNNGFWDATDGRFVAGCGADGNWYDYGYVAWNLEAIYYGVATDEQANSIMNWLTSEDGLYDYEFAPRSNTVSGKGSLNGQWYDADWNFGDNVQYGGAIMYTSFYDLMARINYGGADNAYSRLTAIQDWYMKVYNYYVGVEGADPNKFYRYYYENKGIQLQGSGTEGGLGLDAEFLESYLPLSAVAYGFFGIDSIDGKTLQIAPQLPTELTHWGMENLAFNFVEYDLVAYKNGVQITSVRGETAGLKFQIVLDYTAGQSVYVNGFKSSNYTVENGKVYVTVDMGATVVEVR